MRPRYLADSFGKGVGPFVVSLMIAKFQSRCALRASVWAQGLCARLVNTLPARPSLFSCHDLSNTGAQVVRVQSGDAGVGCQRVPHHGRECLPEARRGGGKGKDQVLPPHRIAVPFTQYLFFFAASF